MTSERKTAANRRNSAKSCGPRTAAGKRTASRNALRHGLAAVAHRPPFPAGQIDRLARVICGDDGDPALLAQARAIVENELMLQTIEAHQITAVKRVQEGTAIAFAKGDNSIALAKSRLQKSQIAYDLIMAELPKLLEKYQDQLPKHPKTFVGELVPLDLKVLLQEDDDNLALIEQQAEASTQDFLDCRVKTRDEREALEEAAVDLIRLDRYHRRAWSRQKRAVRNFMSIKLMRALTGATRSARISA